MNELITICVTSFNRRELLKEAIESCLRQAYRPLEIIVGDDSSIDNCEYLTTKIQFDSAVTFRYHHHAPALGEAKNVDSLFQAAKGTRLLLLHDDDLLCDDALGILDRAWTLYHGVRCVFGKYLIVDDVGRVLGSKTLEQNTRHFRTASHEGRQASGVRVGLQQQFPHNGYLIETGLAKNVGYGSREKVGLCADFDFGIRIGIAVRQNEMAYIDQFVSKYRLSFPSTLRGNPNLGEHLLFRSIQKLALDEDSALYRNQALRRISQGASLSAALSRDVAFLVWLLTSKFYRGHLLSGRTVLCFAALLSPSLATKIWLKRQGRSSPSEVGRIDQATQQRMRELTSRSPSTARR